MWILCLERIHLKHQVLFSLKNKEKYLWMSSAAVVIGPLSVNVIFKNMTIYDNSVKVHTKDNQIWVNPPIKCEYASLNLIPQSI